MNSKKRRPKTTLKDIAQATGYSINTVSRALRKMSDISLETQNQIRAVAEEMQHYNNALASSLRLGYTNSIAAILPDVSNPHFSVMMKGIESQARKAGYASFLINTNEDEDLEKKAIESALQKNVDGIILCPTQRNEQNINFLKKINIPFVLIGRHFETIATDYVVCNDFKGGYQATKFLLDLGHRKILMVSGPDYISSAKERLNGYLHALKENGITADPNLIHKISAEASDCRGVIEKIIRDKVEFSAIFAFSDMIAWRIWYYLSLHGIKIPEQVSIVGFDNIQSRLFIPTQLDTISVTGAPLADIAMEILTKRMKGQLHETKYLTQVLETELVTKGTSIPYK